MRQVEIIIRLVSTLAVLFSIGRPVSVLCGSLNPALAVTAGLLLLLATIRVHMYVQYVQLYSYVLVL
jgi:uncharacterized membrane protein YphA (DoxX/SURF4 family)